MFSFAGVYTKGYSDSQPFTHIDKSEDIHAGTVTMHFAGLLILGGHQQNAAQKRPRTDSDATGNVDWTDDEVELPLGVVRSYSFQKD